MQLIRIGTKLVSTEKINRRVDRILQLRVEGYSQTEVANRLKVDRTFISRLEKMGEIRKGKRVAVFGFPIDNKDELETMLLEEGVEFIFLMNDEERWKFVQGTEGVDLLNKILDLITELRTFDVVVAIASNYRIHLSQTLLEKDVIGVEIGKSPIEEDKYVSVDEIRDIIKYIMT